MIVSRRNFVRTLGALAAGAMLPRNLYGRLLDDPTTNFARHPVPGDGFVLGSLSDGGNVLILPTSAGPIIIDAKFPSSGPDLLADVAALLKAEPTLLIHTHHHADHSGGSWAFGDKARTIAHKNYNPRIADNLPKYRQQAEGHVAELKRGGADEKKIAAAQALAEKITALKAESFLAKEQVEHHLAFEHGGIQVELFHFDNAHTDNDLVVFLPRQNIMHMGDLVFNGLHPFIDVSAKANTSTWQDAIRQVMPLAEDTTIIIPGHGPVTDRTALKKQIEYFDQLREIVTTAIKAGQTRDQVAALKPEAFKDIGFEQLQSQALKAAYDEVALAMR